MSFQQKKQKDGVNKQMIFALNPKGENNNLEPIKIVKAQSFDINQNKSEQEQKAFQQKLNSNIGSFQHIHYNQQKDEQPIQQKQSKLKLIAYKQVVQQIRSTPGLKPFTKALKENQDSLLVKQSINNWDEWDLFLLADGHGLFGSNISKFAIQNLSQSIEGQLRQINNQKSVKEDINQIIQQSFSQVQSNLKSDNTIDLEESGCTMNMILKIQNLLVSANIGDTRSFYYQRSDKPDQIGPVTLKIKQLSVQHTPEKMNEAQRVLNLGGKIEQDTKGFEKTGPLKVKQKKQEIKGVTVTRCFGDLLANQVGVISEPDITKFEITQEGFLMIVTGPILEMIDVIDVCRILTPITPPNSQAVLDSAVMQIIDEARNKAKLQPELDDDYSLILVYISMENV